MEVTRKLASIKKIDKITPITGADLIGLAHVGGWSVIIRYSDFKENDLAVFCEIDSFIPLIPEVEHLKARCLKKMNDVYGVRIKTMKMKGALSQGIVFPLTILGDAYQQYKLGDDVTEVLKIIKYEPPIPGDLSGQVNGNFPCFITKTDQPRAQNILYEIFEENKDARYEVSLKMNGSSSTNYFNNGVGGVCSRNWELKVNEENKDNVFVKMYVNSNLQAALQAYGRNIAVQGELVGPKIQANYEKLTNYELHVFDIYDIDNGCYFMPVDRVVILDALYDLGVNRSMVKHVRVYAEDTTLADLGISNIEDMLKDADGKSLNNDVREGKVYKRLDGKFSFKCISNQYLLKEKD